MEECECETTLLLNAADSEIHAAISSLVDATRSGDVVTIFFGGHAVERNGERYIFGIRADESDGDPPSAGIKLSWIVGAFPADALLLMFIDACRNSYVMGKDVTERGKSQDEFFQRIPDPAPPEPSHSSHVISWSTQPGQYVSDGEVRMHSPYVAALINSIEEGMFLPAMLEA